MTPRLLVQAVQVNMLSTKWILWVELALPGVGHQARILTAMGHGTYHLCCISLLAVKACLDKTGFEL